MANHDFPEIETFFMEDSIKESLADLLREATTSLSPFTGHLGNTGHGVKRDITDPIADARLRMSPYCWCDSPDCPYCVSRLDTQEGYSAHDVLRLTPRFRKAGFIQGEGAPNFHFQDSQVDVRIWWYKYIGRGMVSSPTLDPESAADLGARVRKTLLNCAQDIAKNDLNAAFATACPDISTTAWSCLARSLATHFNVDNPATRAARLAEARDTVKEILDLAATRSELVRVSSLLDDAGVPRYEDASAPAEFRLEFTPSHRVSSILTGNLPEGDDIAF